METLSVNASVDIRTSSDSLFTALITPSSIRRWWSARQAIVHAVPNGLWMATWGEQEDHPDYICGYRLDVCDRPSRLVFADPVYYARDGQTPEGMENARVEFSIVESGKNARLEVVQTGLPADAPEHCEGCKKGWETTLKQLKDFLEESPAR